MNFSSDDLYGRKSRTPRFFQEALILVRELQKLNREELTDLMKISNKIADRTYCDIQHFNESDSPKQSAIFAYSGTVYQWLNAVAFNPDDLSYASEHVRILSGMYGVLKPEDLISSYRLEMKTPLINSEGINLYQFWKNRITGYLQKENQPIINLASAEYTKAVDRKKLDNPFISVSFKEREGEKLRTVGMYSKMARGLFSGRMIKAKIEDPSVLKEWNVDGYIFDKELSSDSDWFYVKDRS